MLLIICVERLLHIGSYFSLRKWRRWPHFPTKLAAVASFSYKIGGGGLIFQQNNKIGGAPAAAPFSNKIGGGKDLATLLVVFWNGLDLGLTKKYMPPTPRVQNNHTFSSQKFIDISTQERKFKELQKKKLKKEKKTNEEWNEGYGHWAGWGKSPRLNSVAKFSPTKLETDKISHQQRN